MKAVVGVGVLAAVASAAAADYRLPKRAELAYSPPFYPSPWADPKAVGWEEAYAKATAFVSDLTLAEKVNLTTGVGWMVEKCVGNTGSIPRKGMRGLCLQDGPVGVRLSDYNSVFPSGQLAAATFDRNLMYARAKAIGEEQRDKGVDILLAPVAGPIGRFAEGGRNWEGFSPDPYLTGEAMTASVKGIQEGAGIIACAKHFIGNEQEIFRQSGEANGRGFNISSAVSSNIDDRTMHELYLWPFADAVKAGVGSFMCSYQQVNNSYGCQNSALMNGLLKDELGFQGFVLSDWAAQHTGASATAAGLDMSMPGDSAFNSEDSYWGANMTLSVINGTIPAWRIDDMAVRIMAAFFKVGKTVEDMIPVNFHSWSSDTYGPLHPYPTWTGGWGGWEQINSHVDVRGEHAPLIREVAARGTVLLKNTGSLPLNKPKLVAVIGEDAGPNSKGPNGCADRGCNSGTLGMAWGSGTANFPYLVTPDSALQAQAIADGSRYESILSNWEWTSTSALVKLDNATTIVFVNANSGEGFIDVDDNPGDRKNLTLWNGGDDLIKNISAICPNTIVVIHSTGPVLVTEWYDNPNVTAILWAGVPGQESGHSITDVLYGRVNPGARTPFTWGPTAESYGTELLREQNNGNGPPQSDFSEGVFIDYRHFDRVTAQADGAASTKPIFEFGFGLSYTTFEYADLKVEKIDAGEYVPTSGQTNQAPTFGDFSTDPADYSYPPEINRIKGYIYPWLDNTTVSPADPIDFLPSGASDGAAQPKLGSSGAPGGNPMLWDIVYVVRATVRNTGYLAGEDVPQLYISLGDGTGENGDPVKMLRGFERLSIDAGGEATFEAPLKRRDVSRWDIVSQDWVEVPGDQIKIWVGASSRNLPLEGTLA